MPNITQRCGEIERERERSRSKGKAIREINNALSIRARIYTHTLALDYDDGICGVVYVLIIHTRVDVVAALLWKKHKKIAVRRAVQVTQ